ncbi:hypothetical protein T11_14569 [Trichinella zimbabwensis]|uniref:Uncharacterized protein n=1 Tax=Trichinella zimbabwensis TaxID=268475 RepID=A0A0V1HYT0_9BILA|nr:hypothetical protein T11_14569 [Trichinella zimbabwensis]KRZ15600.1 hypothetical protein T11_14569 [Trichinella zimbabwensis]
MSFVNDVSSNDAALICEFNVSPSGSTVSVLFINLETKINSITFSVWPPGESWLKFDVHEAGDLSPLLLNDSAGVERFLFISIVINSGSLSLRWLNKRAKNMPASRTTCLAKGNNSSRRVSKADGEEPFFFVHTS